MIRTLAWMLVAALVAATGGCATVKPGGGPDDVAALAAEIRALGPEVAPDEAERAARIAYGYSLQLAREYGVTDPPLVHNAKVIHGLRERGLCNDWTEDLSKRLKQERFRTLTVHWAISPPKPFRIIHHSVVISRRGGTIEEGIVLDPWRHGGALYWARTPKDDHYDWRPRMEVREELVKGRVTTGG
ncbi:hypothetical protein D6850_00120 [Roseovarius spongiae]|uniref:Lipoprotein n=1 Tax=Roseovarius spongiae TaxID=2320272 RepID=A0A3A8AXD5_9RHOB|nr:hypothetical protein [Roseovarius spongiae]RKF16019.1 hypothetical protein D6850_00120 [Roseovarius spongiae]